jgi:hypothetical protein
MLETLFWILVGALIGWNLPQPEWAAKIVEKIKSLVKGK